jgi:hypothetical protein
MSSIVAVHIWPPESDTPREVDHITCDFDGVQGDRHYGQTMYSDTRQAAVFPRGTVIRNHRQVSIVDIDELHLIAQAMGLETIAPGTIADNICTTGIPNLTALPPMTRLVCEGGAVIMLGGENAPCVIAGRMVSAQYGGRPESFPKAAMGHRGVTGWIEHPGVIRAGAGITVVN